MSVLFTTKFPGGYTSNEASIYAPRISGSKFKYTFPGIDLMEFSGSEEKK
jgi:hypothetical protein